MNTTQLIGAFVASAALAACGGSGEESAASADSGTATTSAEMQTAAVDNAAQTPSPAAEAAMASGADAANDATSAMTDTAAQLEAAAQAASDAASAAVDDAGDMAADAAASAADAADSAAANVADAAASAQEAAAGAQDAAASAEPAVATGEDGVFMVAGLTGNAADGRRVWARCQTCHVIEAGVNRSGPSLHGIFGRPAGAVDGFRYSSANADSGVTWTKETMFEYLENPRQYIPGTIMAFPGLRSEQQRADVIAYIAENGGLGD